VKTNGVEIAPQGACGELIGARRATDAEMRPGWSAANVPNCSATISGAWFGSMIPPAPTRMVEVPAATWAITTAVAALAMPALL
jgi:hypothetical protein